MTNGFLVLVPHERLHGTISTLKQRPEPPTNVCKVRAVEDVMPLIAHRMCIAQRALAQRQGRVLALSMIRALDCLPAWSAAMLCTFDRHSLHVGHELEKCPTLRPTSTFGIHHEVQVLAR